jgi:hypothetical protein
MKQTAIEWLVEQLNKEGFAQVVTDEEIQQAKEIEKEQLGKFYNHGQWTTIHGDTFEKHYNKTFKLE